MTNIKGIFFFIITAIYITFYIIYVIGRQLFKKDVAWAVAKRQQVGRGIIAINGIKREVTGQIPEGTYLFISNHRTYMDPVLQAPEAAFIPVAMSEISDWPIMGKGIEASGIVFVKRESKSSRAATRKAIVETIQKGLSVIIYPEGGTNGKPTTKLFRPGTFQIAANNKIPIIPIAIDYKDRSFYWTSDKSFVTHVIETFSKKMEIKLSYGAPIVNENPEALLAATQSWIDGELLRMRGEWGES